LPNLQNSNGKKKKKKDLNKLLFVENKFNQTLGKCFIQIMSENTYLTHKAMNGH